MPAPPTVFIVDDDEAVRDAMRLMCEANGLAAEVYASGQTFLDGFRPERRGCLVLDLRMPGMSGLDLQAYLAARRIHLPIIFITGHGGDRDAADARKAGAMDVIEKPFDPQVLVDRIRQAIAQGD